MSEHSPETMPHRELAEPAPPVEGQIVEINGQRYSYQKVPTNQQVWDSEQNTLVPGYYSLRTWFSHHTDRIGPGPGWDFRLSLQDLQPADMMRSYGYVFTPDEIFNPSGTRDIDGRLQGGMPDDIPYLKLVPMDETRPVDPTP